MSKTYKVLSAFVMGFVFCVSAIACKQDAQSAKKVASSPKQPNANSSTDAPANKKAQKPEERKSPATPASSKSEEKSGDKAKSAAKTTPEKQVSKKCKEGLTLCGEQCVDTSNTPENCGGCGIRCFSNQQCAVGKCLGLGIITAQELQQRLQRKDFMLINVSIPPLGIIPGTDASISHIALNQLVYKIGPDKNARVVLYCGTHRRVIFAIQQLWQRGYKNLAFLNGGVSAWAQAGFKFQQ